MDSNDEAGWRELHNYMQYADDWRAKGEVRVAAYEPFNQNILKSRLKERLFYFPLLKINDLQILQTEYKWFIKSKSGYTIGYTNNT